MVENWLVLHGGALGDLVLTVQLALRVFGRTATLELLARVNPGDLSACTPSIRRRSPEGIGLHWLHGSHDDPPPAPLLERIRGQRVLNALGGPQTIAHQRLAELRPAALFSFDVHPRAGLPRHITEQWATQLEQQGLLVPKCVHQHPAQRSLGVPPEVRQRGARLLDAAVHGDPQASGVHREPGRVVLIHPGSGGRAKCWPLEDFVQIGRLIQRQQQRPVCFLIGPVELETWPDHQLQTLDDEFGLLRCPRPDELVSILAAAAALVGNDAGPSHLAALLGTPSVTVFGPTQAAVWRPLGGLVRVAGGGPGNPGGWPTSNELALVIRALLRGSNL